MSWFTRLRNAIRPATLDRDLDAFQRGFNRWSSMAMIFSAVSVFAATILCMMSF